MTTATRTAASTLAQGRVWTAYGEVVISASPAGVRQVELPRWDGTSVEMNTGGRRAIARGEIDPAAPHGACRHLEHAIAELAQYFGGERRTFSVPLDPVGTPFLRRVWEAVARVPYGQTRSYGEIAAELGVSGAARAVGRANAINPVAPFVPCHRIVGGDGRLTGYGPGLPMKARLLRMEDALPADEDDYDAWVERIAARFPGYDLRLGTRRTRTSCRPGCPAGRAGAQLPARLFLSPDEAARAGFAPCPRCVG